MPRRELPPRLQSYLARQRRVSALCATLLSICLLAGTATALALTTDYINDARTSLTRNIGSARVAARTQLAAASSLPWLDALGDKLFNVLCPLFNVCPRPELAADNLPATAPQLPRPQAEPTLQPQRAAAPAISLPPRTEPTQQSVPQTVINQPVIERVVETVRTVSSGVTEEILNVRLAALAQEFTNRLALVANTNLRQSEIIADSVNESGGSIEGASITGTISAAIDSAVALISDLTANTIGATNATTTNLAVTGSAMIGSATGVLQTTSGVVSTIANGSNGQVLKIVAGVPSWDTDIAGSGGAGAFATTSDSLALYPADPTDVVIVGSNATTSTGNILEVAGASLFRGALTAYNLLTAPRFTATSSTASQFPYASSTAISVSGTASTSALTVSGAPGGLLKTNSGGAVSVATAGTDYIAGVSGDWTGTLDGQEGAFYLANAFATTSANFWQTTRNFFSTTSADYWETQQTARPADDLTNNSIEDLNDVAAITENFGDLFAWNGAAWADVATSTLAIALSDTTGTLGATRGGTGLSSVAAAGVLLGNYAGTGWQQLATSTLGLLTTNVAEGSNLYYLDSRVQSFIHASSTIPKTYTANTFTILQSFTNASSTLFSSNYASSTLWYGGGLASTCAGGNFLTWTAGQFGCAPDQVGAGATFGKTFELVNGALAPTTTVGLLISASSTFSGGASFDRSTTTNATSTSLFASFGRFTNSVVDTLLTAVSATITNLTATTLTATNATTTRLDALDYVAVGRTATTTIRGDGVASIIPYASSTAITVSGTASTSALVVSNLNAANCDVKASPAGVLSCGTDATGGGASFGQAIEVFGSGASAYLAPTTTLGAIISASSTFSGGLTISNSTTSNATTTNLAVTGAASTSNLTVSSGLTLSNLSGFLKATAGAVATSLINLASDIAGILSVANGGTGWSNFASGALLYGNGTGAVATTSAGTNGQVLALLNGVPTWAASTTLATITGTLSVAKGGTGATTATGAASNLQFLYGTSTAIARSYQSRFEDRISVKDFGAVGDGVTDDTTAFQNAINAACNLANGAVVEVPATSVNYVLTATTTIPCGGIEIQGLGMPFIKSAAPWATFDVATSDLLLKITGLHLQGPLTANSYGIKFSGSGIISITKGVISDNNITNFGDISTQTGAAIWIAADTPSLSIENNIFNNAGDGVVTTGPTDGLNISNNYFVSGTGRCVELGMGTGEATVEIRHNIMTCTKGAIYADVSAGHVIIAENEFEAVGTLTDADSAVFNFQSGQFHVTGNTCNINSHGDYCFYVDDDIAESHFSNNLVGGFDVKGFRVGTSLATGYGNVFFNNNAWSGGRNNIYSDNSHPGIVAFVNAAGTSTVAFGSGDTIGGFQVSMPTGDLLFQDRGQLTITDPLNTNRKLSFGYDNTRESGYIQAIKSLDDVKSLLLNPKGGNIGMGTTSPWRTLSVTGTVGFDSLTGATGAGSLCLSVNKEVVYNAGSDACLPSLRSTKHAIDPLVLDALAQVLALQPVSFIYNEGDGRTRYGFIAEDTAQVDEHLATYDAKGDISGIDDRAVLSIVVKAAKELVARLDAFAESFTSKEIHATNLLCIGDTCINEEQLQALLSAASISITLPSPTANDNAPEADAEEDEMQEEEPTVQPEAATTTLITTQPEQTDGTDDAAPVAETPAEPPSDDPVVLEPANDNSPSPDNLDLPATD